jgi:hypothetical protein
MKGCEMSRSRLNDELGPDYFEETMDGLRVMVGGPTFRTLKMYCDVNPVTTHIDYISGMVWVRVRTRRKSDGKFLDAFWLAPLKDWLLEWQDLKEIPIPDDTPTA